MKISLSQILRTPEKFCEHHFNQIVVCMQCHPYGTNHVYTQSWQIKVYYWFNSVLNPTAYTFWVKDRWVYGSKHSSNILNLSTCKQHNTEILMAFVSNVSWRKCSI